MIFQYTWQKVLDGTKTQTRRLVKPGEKLFQREHHLGGYKPLWVTKDSRLVYKVGATYAVQPGYGKPTINYAALRTVEGTIRQVADESSGQFLQSLAAPLRIRIADIRREDVRKISYEDVKAEGFEQPYEFWLTWAKMHDSKFLNTPITLICTGEPSSTAINSIVAGHLEDRPAERYQAWVLTFELARDRK